MSFGSTCGKFSRFAISCGTRQIYVSLVGTYIFFIYFFLYVLRTEARHILAVDLGAEWVKAFTLGVDTRGGASLRVDVVLNDQARRKSPQCVSFFPLPYEGSDALQGVERSFADVAWDLEPRFPEHVVCGISMLAGHVVPRQVGNLNETNSSTRMSNENLISAEYIEALAYTVVPHSLRRDTLAVRISGGKDGMKVLEFVPEELLGMFLLYIRRVAEDGLDGEPLRHLVMTVPSIAPPTYRQAIVDAAAVAGLRAVRLVHTTTAAVVRLAYRSTERFFALSRDSGAKYVMVYSMGSRQTEAAVYALTPSREHLGRIELVAKASNSTLGGSTFTHCIAHYVERELFPKAKPNPIKPVLGVPTLAARRGAIQLLRAVNSARERLSVNKDAPFVVWGLTGGGGEEEQFSATISRATFERECVHVFDEALRVREEVIRQTNGAVQLLQNLSSFQVIGGATRMPRLLERLSEGYGAMVERSLNSDDAAGEGAAYLGASQANIPVRGFDVVEPLMHDFYFSVAPPLNDSGAQLGSSRHLLFARGRTILPAVHSLRFQNRTSNFTLMLEDEGGHFARAVSVRGVESGFAEAKKLQQSLTTDAALGGGRKREVVLESAEVVVDVSVTESGIPFASDARIRAIYVENEAVMLEEKKDENKKGDTLSDARNESHSANGVTTAHFPENHVTEEQVTRREKKDAAHDQEKEQRSEVEKEIKRDKEGYKKKNNDNIINNSDYNGRGNNDTLDGDVKGPDVSRTSTKTREVGRFLRTFALSLASVSVGINLNKTETLAMRDRLQAFQKVDIERLQRATLRNDIESLILHYKSLATWDENEVEGKMGEDVADWRVVVGDVLRWLNEADDFVDLSLMQNQYQRLKELKVETTASI